MIEDFYRSPHTITNREELYRLYELSEQQRIEKTRRQLGVFNPEALTGQMEPDQYCDWLIRRGICPHALITANSRYHFENSVLLDGEMGLKLPDPNLSLSDTPAIFFQAISTVRSERSKVREEDTKNGNKNPQG